MEFLSLTVNLSLLVVDRDVFLDKQDTLIFIIYNMTFHVSLQVDPGTEDLTTQSTFM